MGCDVGCSVVGCDVGWCSVCSVVGCSVCSVVGCSVCGVVWWSVLCGVVWLNVELQSAVPSSPYPCCVHSLAMGHVCTAMCTGHLHFSRLGHGSTECGAKTHCLVHVVCSICNIQVHRVVCMRFTCTYTVAALYMW